MRKILVEIYFDNEEVNNRFIDSFQLNDRNKQHVESHIEAVCELIARDSYDVYADCWANAKVIGD